MGARLWRWMVGDKVRPVEVAAIAVSIAAVATAVATGVANSRHQEEQGRREAREQLQRDEDARAELTSRDGYRDGTGSPLVSLVIDRRRPATPYLDHRTEIHVDNRSPAPISDLHLLLDLKDARDPDSTTAGAVRLSTSDIVPACGRLILTAPPGLDLGAVAPELRGKRIYLQDPQLFFGYRGGEFSLRETGAVVAKPAENSPPDVFPGRRYLHATPIGEVVRVRTTPLDCVARG